MFKKLIRHFRDRVILDKRGVIISAALGGLGASSAAGAGGAAAGSGLSWLLPAAIGGGSALLGGLFGGKDDEEDQPPQFIRAPEYEEAEGARGKWWEQLQQWGEDPNYGAISPDWADIWQTAQQKVKQYFWGGPTQPGLAGKVKASAARRGVSESPALETELTRMGQEEAGMLREMATEQAVQKASFGEQGRQTWLQSLTGLSQQKPAGTWWTPGGESGQTGGIGQMISTIGRAAGQALGEQGYRNLYEEMLDKVLKGQAGATGGPQKTSSGINAPSTWTPFR